LRAAASVPKERSVLFDVQIADRDGWVVLAVVGEVDLATAPQVRQAVIRLLSDPTRRGIAPRLVIDLSGVDLIDSIGLGVLIGALRRVRAADGQLVLVVSEPRVRSVFRATDLDRVFTITESLRAAVDEGGSAVGDG
jgi:anti-sigma B factor antagonist